MKGLPLNLRGIANRFFVCLLGVWFQVGFVFSYIFPTNQQIIFIYLFISSVNIKPPRHHFGFSLAWGWQYNAQFHFKMKILPRASMLEKLASILLCSANKTHFEILFVYVQPFSILQALMGFANWHIFFTAPLWPPDLLTWHICSVNNHCCLINMEHGAAIGKTKTSFHH